MCVEDGGRVERETMTMEVEDGSGLESETTTVVNASILKSYRGRRTARYGNTDETIPERIAGFCVFRNMAQCVLYSSDAGPLLILVTSAPVPEL